MGTSFSVFNILPKNKVLSSSMPLAVTTNVDSYSIATFGMCFSLANPAVSAATAQALGILTPVACKPMILASWQGTSNKVFINNYPLLTVGCKLFCAYSGIIEVINAGQFKVFVN
jgi:hypothetical protein